MKILNLFLIFLIIGCSSQEVEVKTENDYKEVDSIINLSKSTIVLSDSLIKESDEVINEKIGETVNKIQKMKEEIAVAKENLKTIKTVTIRDTVYIETKKNFWGKEKTSTKLTTDSIVVEDSTKN